jgi:hypothetical protein
VYVLLLSLPHTLPYVLVLTVSTQTSPSLPFSSGGFEAKKLEIKAKNGGADPVVMDLWHGTGRAGEPKAIIQSQFGLDFRHSGGGLWGTVRALSYVHRSTSLLTLAHSHFFTGSLPCKNARLFEQRIRIYR